MRVARGHAGTCNGKLIKRGRSREDFGLIGEVDGLSCLGVGSGKANSLSHHVLLTIEV